MSPPESSDNGEETWEREICTEQRDFCDVRAFDRDNGELWIFKVQLIEVLFHLIYSRWFSATTQRLRQQPELGRAGGSDNEFSFGPQQIRARARLGSAAVWISEPCSAQGGAGRGWGGGCCSLQLSESQENHLKMMLTVFRGGINPQLKQSGKFGQPWAAVPSPALLLHRSWGRASRAKLGVTGLQLQLA